LAKPPVEGSSDSAPTDPGLPGTTDPLSYHVIRLADNGGREVVLQLHPPELGDLTVRVMVQGREVTAWFVSPETRVQQAISQAIGQLQTDLGNAGYQLNSAWVGADAWGPRERDASSGTPQPRGAANRQKAEEAAGLATLLPVAGVSVYV
jgi:flagellar hook-length control protein FliK